jgi:hypothetical protein
VFAPYLLSNYEPARDRSSRTGLLALTEMQLNLQALHERTASRSGLPQPGGGPRAVRAQPPPRPSSQPHSLPGPAAAPEIPAPAGPDIDL